jgi:transposase
MANSGSLSFAPFSLEDKTMRSRKKRSTTTMPVVRERVAGADLGSDQHWIAAPPHPDGSPNVRTFGTTTKELGELADWLVDQGVESVAMESTGIYWIPVFEVLEARGLDVVLVNARHLRCVPGRKTDMLDCQWIQRLHSCGLLRGSFRPEGAIARLRTLRRQQQNIADARVRSIQWMQKSLDQMNVLVHRAVTDLTGETGMRIVRAIVAGERDPRVLATFRDPHCKKSAEAIAEYLTGTWYSEHLFNLKMALEHYDHLSLQIASYEAEILREIKALQPPERAEATVPAHPTKAKERRSDRPLRQELWRFAGVDLTRIDGISAAAAMIVLTEIGPDLAAFPTEKHFVAWLRLVPRLAISAGRPVKTQPNGTGSNRVAGALRMAAMSLSRSRSALGAAYRAIARRRDAKTAIFATARRLATLVYRMLRYGQPYVDIGEKLYEQRHRERRLHSLRSSAKDLGFALTPLKEPA